MPQIDEILDEIIKICNEDDYKNKYGRKDLSKLIGWTNLFSVE
jgi:hypothetical protein